MIQNYKMLNHPSDFPIKGFTEGVEVEHAALQQLRNIAQLPFIYKHVAVMPDVHWGIGATVGSVIATKGAIIPAAVGVDIGCGMIAQKLSLTAVDLPDSLVALRSAIEHAVPHGRSDGGGVNDRGAFTNSQYQNSKYLVPFLKRLDVLVEKHPKLGQASTRVVNQLGTLGGGNHFIEICLDENDSVWVMLHSGSRGIGNRIGSIFIEKAKKDMERFFIQLPDSNLAYFVEGSENFNDYFEAVSWAQSYALKNRVVMMEAVIRTMRGLIDKEFSLENSAVECHHNYVARENHFNVDVIVTRKGAVSARLNQLGIIPGSMGAKSFIVSGLGNPDSFNSCSHGAGRRMSRSDAKKMFTVEDHIASTAGVECRKDIGVLDETPGAYKDIDAVMKAQHSLVDVVHTLKQILCVKG